MLSVAEAQTRVLEGVAPLASESVALERAAGRVLSTDLTANVTNPPCDVSAMDGYAVRSSDTNAPGATLRVVGVSSAGDGFGGHVDPGCAVRIFTGAPVPPGADGVLIQENTARSGDFITLLPDAAILPGRHVRSAGLDFKRGHKVYNAVEQLRCTGGIGARLCRANYYPQEYAPVYLAETVGNAPSIGIIDQYFQDGSFVKLRELSASWTLPERWIPRATRTTLTLAARDLLTWTNYRGPDPEVNVNSAATSANTLDQAVTPPFRRFIATLTFVF